MELAGKKTYSYYYLIGKLTSDLHAKAEKSVLHHHTKHSALITMHLMLFKKSYLNILNGL